MSNPKTLPETVHGRIKFLRTMKGFKSATDAARAYGWTISTYLGYENGDREPGKKMAARIADAFGVTISFLLIGEGLIFDESDETFNVPVVSDVGDGGRIAERGIELPVEGYCTISTAIPVLNATVAVRVNGSSMWPRYEDGDILGFVTTGQSLSDLPDACEAVIRLADGERLVRKVTRARKTGFYDLYGHNTPPMFEQTLVWASQVTSVIRSTSVLGTDLSPEARERRRKRIARTAQSDFFGGSASVANERADD